MDFVVVYFEARDQVEYFVIYLDFSVFLFVGLFKEFVVVFFLFLDQWSQEKDFFVVVFFYDLFFYLFFCVFYYVFVCSIGISFVCLGVEQLYKVIDFCDGFYCGVWVVACCFLFYGNDWVEFVDFFYFWVFYFFDKLLGIGGKSFYVMVLFFGVDGIKSQGRFFVFVNVCNDDYFVVWNLQVNIFEIVFLGINYFDIIFFFNLFISGQFVCWIFCYKV